jgi:hypothetical protein
VRRDAGVRSAFRRRARRSRFDPFGSGQVRRSRTRMCIRELRVPAARGRRPDRRRRPRARRPRGGPSDHRDGGGRGRGGDRCRLGGGVGGLGGRVSRVSTLLVRARSRGYRIRRGRDLGLQDRRGCVRCRRRVRRGSTRVDGRRPARRRIARFRNDHVDTACGDTACGDTAPVDVVRRAHRCGDRIGPGRDGVGSRRRDGVERRRQRAGRSRHRCGCRTSACRVGRRPRRGRDHSLHQRAIRGEGG